jgi:hypothetical protein
MSGFIIESLYQTGWRRNSQVYWRYSDAIKEAETQLAEDEARAVRILRVTIANKAVYASEKAEVFDA